MISATQMRPGMVIKYNNELYSIFSVSHRTPGNLRGFVQAKMRSLRSGSMIGESLLFGRQSREGDHGRAGDGVFVRRRRILLLHEHRELRADAPDEGPAGRRDQYLIPQLKVKVEFYEGKAISVELPPTVDMTVVETEPGLKGATVSNVTKPAKMETGLVVQVPPFITEGEKIRVNTTEGSYQARA